jgi:hypothetical protein
MYIRKKYIIYFWAVLFLFSIGYLEIGKCISFMLLQQNTGNNLAETGKTVVYLKHELKRRPLSHEFR